MPADYPPTRTVRVRLTHGASRVPSTAGLALLALLILSTLAAAVLSVVPVHASPVERTFVPCEYEDSVACVWDARHAGNGIGTSFYVASDGRVTRLPHVIAHHLLTSG
jgi:hypothetical protein